jgi:hypothetical protein
MKSISVNASPIGKVSFPSWDEEAYDEADGDSDEAVISPRQDETSREQIKFALPSLESALKKGGGIGGGGAKFSSPNPSPRAQSPVAKCVLRRSSFQLDNNDAVLKRLSATSAGSTGEEEKKEGGGIAKKLSGGVGVSSPARRTSFRDTVGGDLADIATIKADGSIA